MMQKDPSQRLSADEYLEQQKDKVFPQYFYSFLRDYVKEFSTLSLSPDEKVARCVLSSLVSLQCCQYARV